MIVASLFSVMMMVKTMAKTKFLSGTESMRKKIRRIAKNYPDKVMSALRVEAELILTRSKRDFVPVDLGTLRSSGLVGDVTRNGRSIEVIIGFGGAASPYAVAVHEWPSEFDPPTWQGSVVTFSPRGRGAKYLERPLMEAVDGFTQRIANRIQLDNDLLD